MSLTWNFHQVRYKEKKEKKQCYTDGCFSVLILMTALAPVPRGTEVNAKSNLSICSSAEDVQLCLPASLIILFGTDATGRTGLLQRLG